MAAAIVVAVRVPVASLAVGTSIARPCGRPIAAVAAIAAVGRVVGPYGACQRQDAAVEDSAAERMAALAACACVRAFPAVATVAAGGRVTGEGAASDRCVVTA